MPGQFDRYSMKREITLTAVSGGRPGSVSRQSRACWQGCSSDDAEKTELERQGLSGPDHHLRTRIRAAVDAGGLAVGLVPVVIFLMLSANFQSLRLSLVAVSTAAVISGVALVLFVTRTTLTCSRLSARSWRSAWPWPAPFCW